MRLAPTPFTFVRSAPCRFTAVKSASERFAPAKSPRMPSLPFDSTQSLCWSNASATSSSSVFRSRASSRGIAWIADRLSSGNSAAVSCRSITASTGLGTTSACAGTDSTCAGISCSAPKNAAATRSGSLNVPCVLRKNLNAGTFSAAAFTSSPPVDFPGTSAGCGSSAAANSCMAASRSCAALSSATLCKSSFIWTSKSARICASSTGSEGAPPISASSSGVASRSVPFG